MSTIVCICNLCFLELLRYLSATSSRAIQQPWLTFHTRSKIRAALTEFGVGGGVLGDRPVDADSNWICIKIDQEDPVSS